MRSCHGCHSDADGRRRLIDAAIRFDYPEYVADLPGRHTSDRIVWDVDDELCSVDDAYYFIRANIELPIIGSEEAIVFVLWASISQNSHQLLRGAWRNACRADHVPAVFGYLQNHLRCYAEATLHLPVNVVQRAVGIRPLLVFNPQSQHQLAIDHRHGVDQARAAAIMSTWIGGRPDGEAPTPRGSGA